MDAEALQQIKQQRAKAKAEQAATGALPDGLPAASPAAPRTSLDLRPAAGAEPRPIATPAALGASGASSPVFGGVLAAAHPAAAPAPPYPQAMAFVPAAYAPNSQPPPPLRAQRSLPASLPQALPLVGGMPPLAGMPPVGPLLAPFAEALPSLSVLELLSLRAAVDAQLAQRVSASAAPWL